MTVNPAFNLEDLAWSSLGGVARGIIVHSLLLPLEVVKIRQQCHGGNSKAFEVARKIFEHEGMGAFYRGLKPQLTRTAIKQFWCWPVITFLPPTLKEYHIENLPQQALTGLTIATIDACVSSPLERAKIILSASKESGKFSLIKAYRNGWKGFATQWSKLSVGWVTFLTSQKYLRDRNKIHPQDKLSLAQMVKIGTQVALLVSVTTAPFDLANTVRQTQNLNLKQLIKQKGVRYLYRGWPLSAVCLIIQNIASVILIEKLT